MSSRLGSQDPHFHVYQTRQYVDPYVKQEMKREIADILRHIDVITRGMPEPAAVAQFQNEVSTTLANQFATSLVTKSPPHMLVDLQSSSSGRPSVIVSDIPESNRQLSSSPRVIARDIVDFGNGQSVVLPNAAAVQSGDQANRTGQKRKAEENEASSEQAPSPKERRNEGDEAAEPQAAMPEAAGLEKATQAGGSTTEEDVAKERLVQQLLEMILFYTSHDMPFTLEQQFRKLPIAKLQSTYEDLKTRERNVVHTYRYGFGNQGQFHQRGPGPHSDEESDEELMKKEAVMPSKAKFQLTSTQMLTRCMILGSPTQVRVKPDASINVTTSNCISDMIREGIGEQAVELLKDISTRGRSPRQDTLLQCLALCCRSSDLKTKHAAYAAIQEICRIPTHLFQLVEFIEKAGETSGWGRGLRKALRIWYNSNAANPLHLAMHVTKYWQRNGWCHRDLFRLSHIKPVNDTLGFIVRYCVKGMKEAEEEFLEDGYLGRVELEKVHKYLQAVEEVKKCEDSQRTVQLVQEYNLVREHLRTEMLNKPEVWEVMLPTMPLFALMRNLNKMTNVKLFDKPANVETVVSKFSNTNAMKKARIHPLKLLLTHRMYQRGYGDKGSLQWKPNQQIVVALEKAFYASFDAVEPTNKRILIALDISGSMDAHFVDYPFSIREASTVMAMVTIRKEPKCDVVGFHHKLIPLDMFKDTTKTLEQLANDTRRLGFGSTDCSKPMTWARKHKKEYDAFIIYTDSETNTHRITPYQALEKYRREMKLPNTKFMVVGMSGCEFTVSQPEDIHSMDVVGFDPDTPDIIRGFLAGEFDP